MPKTHSPLPWYIGMRPGPMIYGQKGEQIADMTMLMLGDQENRANAALIVRAVNSHAEIVAALENLIAAENDYGDPDNVAINQALAAATSALARAKGEA